MFYFDFKKNIGYVPIWFSSYDQRTLPHLQEERFICPTISEDSDHRIRDIWLHVLEQNILPGESRGEKLLNLIMDRKLKKTEKDSRTRPIPNKYLLEILELTKVSNMEPNI